MLYAIKIRLYPSKEQETYFMQTFGCCRWVFNNALAFCQKQYEAREKRPAAYEVAKRVVKQKDEYLWLSDVDSQALKQACADVDSAYKNFFRRVKNGEKPGFPRFKSKHHGDASYTTTSAANILNRSLADVSLGEFFRQLEYKSAWRGVALLKVSRWEPTSKRCSRCGAINENLMLADRHWFCSCGAYHHRDINAAINIAARAA